MVGAQIPDMRQRVKPRRFGNDSDIWFEQFGFALVGA
jgi:hypothetical protein